ncbi:MAG TPA: 2-dehydropantoate 2-reductase [Burkholderiales bacterium]|nr:2-dehydropantoate 2-reductase [Burkholderiales bacterium]
MKICVVGAGSIGGLIAAYLARSGFDTSVVARGAHLRAIQAQGLTLVAPDERFTVKLNAAADPAALGVQEIVFLGLKAHQIPEMLPRLGPLIGSHTVVVPAINGLPWWYFFREGGAQDGQPIRCLDPQGVMFGQLDPHHIIGCVVHAAAEVSAPGEIRSNGRRTFYLGEPDGSLSRRLNGLTDAMVRGGLEAHVSDNIRAEVWMKLVGNLTFNPVAALTRANLTEICDNPALIGLIRRGMEEGNAVSAAYGVPQTVSIDKRLEIARGVGPVRSSMLQDLEAGRAMEIEPIIGSVVELARTKGIPTPCIDLLYAMVTELARHMPARGQ